MSLSVQENCQQEERCQGDPLLLLQPLAEPINVASSSTLPQYNVSTIEDLKSRVTILEGPILVLQQQQERTCKMLNEVLRVLNNTYP